MPEVANQIPLRRFLARHGWLVAIAVTYLYAFPYFPKINSANELPRVYLVKAIADDHTFAIDHGVARWGSTADVSPSGSHVYSNKAPGSSMLAAPPYLVVRLVAGEPGLAASVWISRLFAGIVPTLLFLLLVYGFLERWIPEPAIRQLVLLAYALGSMAMTYSILFYSHQLGGVCIASAWILALDVADRKRGLGALAAAGALAGSAALVDYQAIFAVVPVAVHVIVKLARWPRRELAIAIAVATVAAAIPIGVLLLYHAACFGSPWRTGYDASVTFAANHQQGFLGLTKLRWEAFYGSLFKIDNGLFALAPWLLLALPGAVVLALGISGDARSGSPEPRRDRGTALVGIAVVVIYVLFVSAINFWRGGWGVGPRYITAMLPFMLPLVAGAFAALRRYPIAFGAAAGLVVVGVTIYTLASLTFPYWPDSLQHPLFEVTFRMLREDLVAPNLASACGIEGVLGIVPVLALVAFMVGNAIRRSAGWTGLGVAAVIGTLVLVGYGLVPHGGANAERVFRSVRAAVVDL